MDGSGEGASIPGVTAGVEEEFLLLDPHTGQAVPKAAAVLADAAPARGEEAGTLQPELLRSQVEAATGRCTTSAQLRAQLRDARHRLARAAVRHGAVLVSSGTPVADGPPPGITEGDRFGRIAEEYAAVVTGYQACGCHVHVAVPDEESAVAVVNHLRPWLPTLLALSANSPFHRGRDTGCASWRVVQQLRFPGAGVPPHFESAAAYREQVARLVECGALIDREMSFWLVRPSPRLPTVELRVADALPTAADALVHAVLARALVRTALDEVARGRPAPAVRDQVAAAAVWAAARYGVTSSLVDPVRERRVPAAVLLRELVERVTPALREAGDADVVPELLRGLALGGGAERQRRAAAGGTRSLVRALAQATSPGSADDETTPEAIEEST
ncbi:glutamate--cysteine ligase [Saccharopolyspora sp. NFXS83]|uniref:carboxylate-amine ligase n=1 Tax=Saccharopolyspora sp. NFXS83 TaxID=2993560 RepID=UPI00224B3E3E|nr:glutamate--cysteine ligase [Saccharopolyspora sp. NFXS83]MCX2729248.1 glutamate--cysteine ligase [Saccharopolyspora sp. NFXS83]